ncbi:hypothetical protein F2Q68_00011340 [Brassica cretica]|uniref:Uncharacterized protein n=1 Tax=Brassica cretica TaxID=69181 RepID=A0A8S9L111_BRACR|nr:hypothetical protein F2Q68_00011340 [Brassica cretica]
MEEDAKIIEYQYSNAKPSSEGWNHRVEEDECLSENEWGFVGCSTFPNSKTAKPFGRGRPALRTASDIVSQPPRPARDSERNFTGFSPRRRRWVSQGLAPEPIPPSSGYLLIGSTSPPGEKSVRPDDFRVSHLAVDDLHGSLLVNAEVSFAIDF